MLEAITNDLNLAKDTFEARFEKIEETLEAYNPAEGHIKFLKSTEKFKKKTEKS